MSAGGDRLWPRVPERLPNSRSRAVLSGAQQGLRGQCCRGNGSVQPVGALPPRASCQACQHTRRAAAGPDPRTPVPPGGSSWDASETGQVLSVIAEGWHLAAGCGWVSVHDGGRVLASSTWGEHSPSPDASHPCDSGRCPGELTFAPYSFTQLQRKHFP